MQVFPPFRLGDVAPSSSAMLLDLIREFVVDLVRTLLIEELCRYAREHGARLVERRRRRRLIRQALHRIATENRRKV